MKNPARTQRKRGSKRRLFVFCFKSAMAFIVITTFAVTLLRWFNPPTSAFMLNGAWRAWREGHHDFTIHQRWVDYDHISPHAKLAVIAAEDQLFPSHRGFDLKSIKKAVADYLDGRRLRGASTITQQTAKNLFLWPGKSFIRKGVEAWFTLLIEWLWSKQRILELYLNIAQFGPDVYGVEAAAGRFFHIRAKALNRRQASQLAAVLPNPVLYRVNRQTKHLRGRQNWIADQMLRLGGRNYLKKIH